MDIEKYKKTFEWLEGNGHTEMNVDFKIVDGSPSFNTSGVADRLEMDLEEAMLDEIPTGVSFIRKGQVFRIDLFAYNHDTHLDYFGRVRMCMPFARYIEPLPRRIPTLD